MDRLNWAKKSPGIWSAVVGKADDYSPFSAIDVKPSDSLKNMSEKPFPFNIDSIITEKVGNKTVACFSIVLLFYKKLNKSNSSYWVIFNKKHLSCACLKY